MNALVSYDTQELLPPELELSAVPCNLIPTDSRSINHEWAQKTFRYAYLFGRSFGISDWQDNQNVQAWIEKGLQLQTELRELGVRKAHEKIISIFREYNIYMPDSTQRPTNIDDILVIINDKNWYTTQQDTKQTLIHMISYGIFRQGYNHWAMKVSKEWLFTHKIRIDEKALDITTSKTTRQKKGFVYTNLVQRASNSISDRIQKNMISNHGQYIAVRKNPSSQRNLTHRYEAKRFNNFEGYIVYPSDTLLNVMNPKEQIKRKIKDSITLALRNEISFQEIEHIVNECRFSEVIDMGKSYKNICISLYIFAN